MSLSFLDRRKVGLLRWMQRHNQLNAGNMNYAQVFIDYGDHHKVIGGVVFDTLRYKTWRQDSSTGGLDPGLHRCNIDEIDWSKLRIGNQFTGLVDKIKWYHLRFPITLQALSWMNKTKNFVLG